MAGQNAARGDAATQISALCLKPEEAHPNYSVNGCVFFPRGSYRGVQMTLLNIETEETRTLTTNWSKDGATSGPSEPSVRGKPSGIDSQETE